MKQTKFDSWRKFVTSSSNSETWVLVYKIQAQKLRVRGVLSTLRRNKDEHTIDTRETASLLLNAHVPDDRECEDTPAQREIREGALFAPDNEDTVQFTEREVAVVVKSLKNDKAPGPDKSKSVRSRQQAKSYSVSWYSSQRVSSLGRLSHCLEGGIAQRVPERRREGREEPEIVEN